MLATVLLRKRDGTELASVATVCFDKSIRKRLSRPRSFTFRVPSDDPLIWTLADDGLPYLCAGYRQVLVYLNSTGGTELGDLWFNGVPWSLEDDGDEDMVYTRVTCYDPMMFWPFRPARDPDGNFIDPKFLKTFDTGPQIIQALLDASENAGIGVPDDAEGPTFLDWWSGTFELGGPSLRGAPTNWPMTIADIASLLTNTGQLDIIIEPVDDGPIMGQVNCYNGDYGRDLTSGTGAVVYDYATGSFNVKGLRRTEDMTKMCNKLWWFLGPKQDLEHWKANITGDDPLLPGNAGDPTPVGGALGIPGGALPGRPNYVAPASGQNLGDLLQISRDILGCFMEVRITDDVGTGQNAASPASTRPMWRRVWQEEQLWRSAPQQYVFITPTRDDPNGYLPGAFDVGDLIAINVGSKARYPVTNMEQRIYAFTVDIDDDAVAALGDFQASPDMDQIG